MVIQDTLDERKELYGAFETHAFTSQVLKTHLHQHGGWKRLSPSQREALEMIQHKIARILNGDPDYSDSWHDIAGYATLVENELNES